MQDADRFQGYVADAGYTDRFFRELSPSWLRYVSALHGLTPHPLDTPFTYLELGCGFGASVVVNAAAYPHATFHACDINPAHIDGARKHAEALGVRNLVLHETTFADLRARDLPPFDFLALHGVYSWVSAEARDDLRRVIAAVTHGRTLVYVSYNCLPGWAAEIPLRRLLVELAATAEGDSAARTAAAVRELHALASAPARYFSAHQPAAAAVDSYTRSPANYLAHEFLNENWEPFYSVDVADQLAGCGLRYLGSATLADNYPLLTVDTTALSAVQALTTPRQRQLAMDFAVNQRFRRDVFATAPAGQPGVDLTPQLPVTLAGFDDLAPRVRVPRGDVRFQPGFVEDLTALLAHGAMTIRDVAQSLGRDGVNRNDIVRNVGVLVAGHALTPCAVEYSRRSGDEAPPSPTAIAERALTHVVSLGVSRAIPSPVTGNGILVHPVEAIGVLALARGILPPAARSGAAAGARLAAEVEAGMRAHNITVSHEGETLLDGAAVSRYASAAGTHILSRVVPAFTRLGLLT